MNPIPDSLPSLQRLLSNFWWTWNPEAHAFVRSIDPNAFDAARGSTARLLSNISARRWRELSRSALEHAANDRRALTTVVTLVELADRVSQAGSELLADFSELARFAIERYLQSSLYRGPPGAGGGEGE